jgi:glycosyltransferase involved in cell wall biosynthesis
MSYSNQAKEAFYSGNYVKAIGIYEEAISEQPELAHIYRFHLNLVRRRLNLSPGKAQTLPLRQSDTEVAESPPASIKERAPVMLEDLYREAAEAVMNLPAIETANSPLVSVLMTAHNVAGYIEQAVTSVLRQTWPRLELIVVDDASNDETWAILQRLAKSEANLRCLRLNTNLGTYFAKNYALTVAQGDFIFFQDGDDLCHPDRIRLGMHELNQPGVVCVRGAYSRVQFPSGQVIPVNGLVKKLGLITLGVRRSVFDDIGFFNCTSKASDDEFFQRLKTWIVEKGGKIRDLKAPLYFNTLRDGSLFADMIANDPAAEGNIVQLPSPSRASYVKVFSSKHKELRKDDFKRFFRFPVVRDLLPVAPDMTYLPNPALPIVAALCSIPERAELLRQTLKSLAPQVDAFHVYLDRYDTIPDFVRMCHPQVKVVLSRDVPGLGDTSKFLPFPSLSEECYYLTADDNVLYPPDYVASVIRRIELYGRQVVIGVHGVLVPDHPEEYSSDYRKVFSMKNGLERDALVNNLGTGTVGLYSGLLRGLDLSHFRKPGMTDLFLSVYCKERLIPMVAIARPENWLQEIALPTKSSHREVHQSYTEHAMLVRENRPWGYAAIHRAVEGACAREKDEKIVQHLRALMPDLHACLR